jgi:AcrR family transcriptional regulator
MHPLSAAVFATPVKSLSFRAVLQAQSDNVDFKKGARTDLRIRWAACELLEETSLAGLKVQDICTRASVAQGTFYQYFVDRDELLRTLLQDFVAFVRECMLVSEPRSNGSPNPVRAATLTYSHLFEQNRGLMKCLMNHYEEFPQARAIFQEMNRGWIETVVKSLKKKRKTAYKPRTTDDELFRRCYALGGMVDQYLSYLFLYGDDNVTAVAGDLNAVVNTLTFIWNQTFALEFDPA